MKKSGRILLGLVVMAAAVAAGAAVTTTASAAPRVDPGGTTSRTGVAPRIDPGGGRGASGSTSLNWAGYSASGGTYGTVTATWTQPAVVRRTTETYAAFWVGLDGDGSDTVEQIGTLGYTYGGRSYYMAWYEMYPAALREITSLTISPGDQVTATVQWVGSSSYRLTLQDVTTGKSFTTTQTSSSAQRASAEVIAEAPSDGSGVLPLATFGLASFTACAIDGAPLAAAGATSIDMADPGGAVIAATSALDAAGSAFTVSDDFTAPKVTATGLQTSAARGWKKAAVNVRLTGSDGTGGSGVAAVHYTLDGGLTQTYSGAVRVAGAGSHVVRYWAVDKAGNTSAKKTGYVNLDLAAPSSAAAALRVRRAAARRGSVLKLPVNVNDETPSSGSVRLVTRITTRSGRTLARVVRAGVRVDRTVTVRIRLTTTLRRGVYSIRTLATDAAGNVQRPAGRSTLRVR